MVKFAGNDPWDEIAKDLQKPREPVTAVISYIGASGDQIMALIKGDKLVCDASPARVKLGLTNAMTLQRLHKKGIEIFSVSGLHAKVIVGKDFAWVGSANASSSGLIDASVRLGKSASVQVRSWVRHWCIPAYELTAEDLKTLVMIPVPKKANLSRPRLELPSLDYIIRLQFLWLGGGVTKKAEKAAEREFTELKSVGRLPRGAKQWDWIEWRKRSSDREKTMPKPGTWIIPVSHGRLERPGFIERISDHKTFSIVWFRKISTTRIPKQSEMQETLASWGKWDGVAPLTISRQKTLEKVLDLYR
jgi:hypothetical protein